MASYNKTELIGNVVADPDFKDKGVVRFRIATDQYVGKDADGKVKYKGVYWNCVSFNHSEYISKFVGKGTQVFVEAQLMQNEFKTQDGMIKTFYEYKVSQIIALQRAKSLTDVQSTVQGNRTQENENYKEITPIPSVPPLVESNKDLFGEVVTGTTDDIPF